MTVKSLSSLTLALAMTPVAITSLTSCQSQKEEMAQGEQIFYADPTIYAENGKFYLTGTRNREPLGFALLESTDLKNWTPARPDSMILTPGETVFGTMGFWAPQIIKDGNRYLFAYTANEQTVLAASDSLNGIYTQAEPLPIDGSEKNIDPFLFTDSDGRSYLYHVRFDNGNFLWVGEFDPATGKIKEGTLQRCFVNDQPWEATPAYESAPIMEGPTVIKIDDLYYLFYSSNHFISEYYAVGYATAPTPVGPWTKNPANPIIHQSIVGEKGSGHGDIFTDNDGKLRYVYHVHNSDSVVSPRRTRIITLNVERDSAGPARITADPATIIIPVKA